MSAAAPLRLYLIRHGETEWSLAARHTGRTEIALTVHGAEQAASLAPQLRAIRFAHVLTSPRQRAQRTCALAGLAAMAAIEADLAEWDYGAYEGQRTADIWLQRPGWNLYRDGCPQGESPAQVCARADRLVARLRMLDGNIALFSHGQFGGALAARWIGLPLTAAAHFPLGTASLSMLGFDPHHPDTAVIASWNASPSGA